MGRRTWKAARPGLQPCIGLSVYDFSATVILGSRRRGTRWRFGPRNIGRGTRHVPNGKVAEVPRMLKAINAQEDHRAEEIVRG